MQLYMTVNAGSNISLTAGRQLSPGAPRLSDRPRTSHLHRRAVTRQTQNGLLAHQRSRSRRPWQSPPRSAARSCASVSPRSFEGVAADLGAAHARRTAIAFLEELGTLLHRNSKKTVRLRRPMAAMCPDAYILINTALSGGTLQHHALRRLPHLRPAPRGAMDIERRAAWISCCPPPAAKVRRLRHRPPSTASCRLSLPQHLLFRRALRQILHLSAATDRAHFVLFDDADTIRCKLKLGRRPWSCATRFCSAARWRTCWRSCAERAEPDGSCTVRKNRKCPVR